MNKTGKKVLINLSILGISAIIIGGLIGVGFLINHITDKNYISDNIFDVNQDGMLMIAAKTYYSGDIQYSCINKDKSKFMSVSEFESDEFTAYKWTYLDSGYKFIDDDKNEIKENETVVFFKDKANEFKRKSNFNFIIYKSASTYLFSYESDYRGYCAFNLTYYNSQDKSLSLIRTYQGNEVVGLKILSELK